MQIIHKIPKIQNIEDFKIFYLNENVSDVTENATLASPQQTF